MRSKKSFFNKTIFFNNIKRYSPLWIVYLLLLLIHDVGTLLSSVMWINQKNGYSLQEIAPARIENLTYAISNCIDPPICFVVAAVVAVFIFSYLHMAKSSNMIHSLPISRNGLFFTNYLSGLVMLVVPVLITLLPMAGVCMRYEYPYMNILLLWLAEKLGSSFLFYSMAVLTCMVTGVVFAAPFYYVVLNYLVYGVYYIAGSLVMSLCYGMNGSLDLYLDSPLSPLHYIRNHVMVNWEYAHQSGGMQNIHGEGYGILAAYCAAAVVITVIAFLIYKKRNMEDVGKLITVKWIMPVFRWGVAVCASFFACMMISDRLYLNVSTRMQFAICIIVLFVVGTVAFFVVEMCLQKKLKVFSKKKFIELACYLAVVMGAASLLELDVFGVEKRVPDPEDVTYVSLYTAYQIMDDTPEAIENIVALHKQIVEDKEEYETYYERDDKSTFGITLTYRLKNGKTWSRNYDLPASEEYLADNTSMISKVTELTEREDYFMGDRFCMNYDNNTYTGGSMDIYNDELEGRDVSFSDEEAAMIVEAYLQDLKEGNAREALGVPYSDNHSEKIYYNDIVINFSNTDGIQTIYEYMQKYQDEAQETKMVLSTYNSAILNFGTECVHTLEVLKKIGVESDGYRLMTYEDYNELSDKIYNTNYDTDYVPADYAQERAVAY